MVKIVLMVGAVRLTFSILISNLLEYAVVQSSLIFFYFQILCMLISKWPML